MDGMNDMGLSGGDPLGGEVGESPKHSLEQCVPLASLGVPGEGEQMENPEVGDEVNYEVAGKVTRIEGDKAYVTPASVNGQPIEDKAEVPPADGMAGLEESANQLGYLGVLLGLALLLFGIGDARADRIGSGPIAIERTNGAVTGSFDSIAKAVAQANAGETVIVGPGVYWENDLLKNGVNLHFQPGAVLKYIQETTNASPYGFIDDRGKGACTNTIILDDIYYMSSTNLYYDSGFVYDVDVLGPIVITNPASRLTIRGKDSYCSLYQLAGASLAANVIVKDCQTNTFIKFDNLLQWGTNITLFDHDFEQDVSVAPTEHGIVWLDGEFTMEVPGTISPRGYYGIWGDLPGDMSGSQSNAVSNLYITFGRLTRKIYVDGSSDNYKLWAKGYEIEPGDGSYQHEPLTFFGAGHHYVDVQKIKGRTGGPNIISTAPGLTTSNVVVWIRTMNSSLSGATRYGTVGAGELKFDAELIDEELAAPFVISGNGKLYASYGVTNSAGGYTRYQSGKIAGDASHVTNMVASVSLTADNQVIGMTTNAHFYVASDNGTAGNRTFVLTSGIEGKTIRLLWSGTNAGELVDDAANSGSGNVRLNGTWTPTQYDVLTLEGRGTDWHEVSRSAN